jgi:hypothetical protein
MREIHMNLHKPQPPKVTHISWGTITIEGLGSGKDYKLWPGGGRPWDWTETQTSHHAGIQPADIVELMDHGCTTVVLSRGMQGRLTLSHETLELLQAKNVDVRVAKTKQAVKIYNKLAAEGIAVGGLFHTTC